MKKWITFDLDGTLMQNPFVGYVFPEIEQRIMKLNSRLHNVTQHLVEEHKNRMDNGQYAGAYDWDDIVSVYLQANNVRDFINVKDILVKHCKAPNVYLLEQPIVEVLGKLKQKGYALAVVTNGFTRYQLPVMDVLDLTHHFDVIVTPEEARCAKPDERIYKSLLDEGEIVAHVGDRIDHDVISANILGVRSIWIHRNLPEMISRLPINERSGCFELLEIALEKLRKETQTEFDQLPAEAIPKEVICNIEELLTIL
ncbi:HAD family hydrolase [Sporosarcina sp. Te-1]|uniref:HAD family hydrolase n=1 Tax=Sporosarcina sp. Te-1 TaxID=2818390 RepID=UPI001FB0B155|nr:HAD family hydrolase [Sporosarcina sp. Te-1]